MSLVQSGVVADLDNTLGAVFIGQAAACMLFGITSLQTYLYYHHFSRDYWVHKVSVGVLWSLDALHLVFALHTVYHYLVTGFGKYDQNIVWSVKGGVLVNVIIILVVQCLYAYRVWLLGGYHRGVLGYLVISVVTVGFVIGIVLSYETFTLDSFANVKNIAWAVDASFAASTGIDFVLSMAMCWYLRKSQGVATRLNSRISNVMQYSLGSGLITTACSLGCLFTFTLMPNTLIYLGLEFLVTKLYVGSFLAMLNARRSDTGGDEVVTGSFSIASLPLGPTSNTAFTSPQRSNSQRSRKYLWEEPGIIEAARPPGYGLSPREEKAPYAQHW
ncbi:hypothetical protein C8J56DRAFT_1056082 [Mycena floridula]|nr:hypothetical protein C8J56DRAFT_1059822 [Mycena floridula]KAJ7583076.1 hypothetical protein C8J56DRAFT_1056082 [Mycena floridula]